jgi:SAM-dependent methyltransferase
LSHKNLRKTKPENSRLPLFFEFERFYTPAHLPDSLINFLFNDRLRRINKMMDFLPDKEFVALDVGCFRGYFTQYLAQQLSGMIIGIDVSRNNLFSAKTKAHWMARHCKYKLPGDVEFVCSDINYLPFKKESIDIIVTASVLEHLKDLERAIKQMRDSMRKSGCLIAGYPIETSLFIAFLRLFMPDGLIIRDSRIWGKEKFEKSPETHKQSFINIRYLLQKYFFRTQRQKSFFTILPDQLCWYETVRMVKKS